MLEDKIMTEAAVSVQNLRKAFPGQEVLSDVSFEVPCGQTFALLGRNGAGKTTALRILLGLLPADGGTVRVLGRDPAREPLDLRRRVGYLAEDQVMYGWMTPVELCRFLRPFYPTWDTRLADDYLDRFELPRHTRIGRLSKGQSVKLGLAVALAHRPEVAILDDPALALDPISRKEFNRDLIEHLQAAGRTVIYSSHLLAEVETVADAVAILDRGRIVRHSATDALRDEVKQFVLPFAATHDICRPAHLLDARLHGDRLVVVVDGATDFIGHLEADGVEHEVVSLSLDEIFEAFVIGRPQAWPEVGTRSTASI
jgi:ABC-2 type transport system ATP-binding protein